MTPRSSTAEKDNSRILFRVALWRVRTDGTPARGAHYEEGDFLWPSDSESC